MQLIFFDIEKYITLIRLIFIPNFSKSSFSNHAYFSFEARKKKSTNKMEDKKIDNDIEAKLAEALVLKKIIDAIKDLVTDVNIDATP